MSLETLTFLFTDIEGSTRLLGDLGPDRYAALLRAHHGILRAALGEAAFDQAVSEGAALDLEGLYALALAEPVTDATRSDIALTSPS